MNDWSLPLWMLAILGIDGGAPDPAEELTTDEVDARFQDLVQREWGIWAIRSLRLPRRGLRWEEPW